MKNFLLFVVFPYVAIALEIVVSLWRYIFRRHEFTSLSSEFLESKKLFWGSVPWHYGILAVLIGHLIGLLFPREVLLWNRVPVRLLILEVTGLTFGLLALVGIVLLIARRISDRRIRQVTSKVDVLVLVVLLAQVASGVAVAVTYRWGSSWYASALVPYLRSLFTLNPNVEFVAGMPLLVKVHVFTAFLIVAILPFTRLIHFLVVPVSYLWRPYQLVVWNYDRRKIRRASINS